MKRAYEVAVVLRMDPNPQVIEDALNQVQDWIRTDADGNVTKVDRWGQRRLAYQIDRQRDGYYAFISAEMESRGLDELENNLRLAQNVLRFLVIRQDD